MRCIVRANDFFSLAIAERGQTHLLGAVGLNRRFDDSGRMSNVSKHASELRDVDQPIAAAQHNYHAKLHVRRVGPYEAAFLN